MEINCATQYSYYFILKMRLSVENSQEADQAGARARRVNALAPVVGEAAQN